MQDREWKERIENWAKERDARDKASIRFGFAALIVIALACGVWFLIWNLNPDVISRALTEIKARSIDLPRSKLTYPIDGAPLLEEQWGFENIPNAPFRKTCSLDLLIVEKAGQWLLIESEEGDHVNLIIAADKETRWRTIRQGIASLPPPKDRVLWLATKTPGIVGKPGEEIKLERYEMSDLGVIPVAIRDERSAPEESRNDVVVQRVSGDATFANVVETVESVFALGKDACLLQVEQAVSTSPTRPGKEE